MCFTLIDVHEWWGGEIILHTIITACMGTPCGHLLYSHPVYSTNTTTHKNWLFSKQVFWIHEDTFYFVSGFR